MNEIRYPYEHCRTIFTLKEAGVKDFPELKRVDELPHDVEYVRRNVLYDEDVNEMLYDDYDSTRDGLIEYYHNSEGFFYTIKGIPDTLQFVKNGGYHCGDISGYETVGYIFCKEDLFVLNKDRFLDITEHVNEMTERSRARQRKYKEGKIL